jgi:CHAT domain-containing protein/tetratricopeptide (TPR) repeat protein
MLNRVWRSGAQSGSPLSDCWAVTLVLALAFPLSVTADQLTPGPFLAGHRHAVNSLSFSVNGKLLASAGADQVIKLWDYAARKEERTLRGASAFLAVATNPALSILAAGDADVISVWSTRDGKLIGIIRGYKGPVRSLAFSLDGKTLASAGDDGTVRLWDLRGKEVAVFRGHTGRVNAVVLSWDGKFVASAGDDGLIKIWDIATHELRTTLRGHAGPVLSLACAFSNQQLASGGLDRTVRLWRLPEGEMFRTLQGHRGGVYALAYSLDGRSLFSGGADRTVWLWDSLLGKAWDVYRGFKDAVGAVVISMDKKTLAVGTVDGSIELRPLEPLPKFSESAFKEALDAQKLGAAMEKAGKWPEAVEHYRKYAALAHRNFGPLGEFTAILTDHLGEALVMVDQPAKGAVELQRALDVWETLADRKDLIASSAIVLGVCYRDLGDLARSAALLERALKLREAQVGLNDLKTATAQYGLATTYYHQGRFVEAQTLLQKSLETRETKLGPDNRLAALSASGLGAVYAAVGQPDRALPLYARAARVLLKGGAQDILNGCSLLNNLALLYAGLGQFEVAEDQLQRCLELMEKVVGKNDIGIVNSLNSLATIYLCTKQYAKAESLLIRSLAIIERTYGRDHPSLSAGLANLAALYIATGRPAEAEKLLSRALSINEAKVGRDHPDLVTVLYALAGAEVRMGNRAQAELLLARALAIAKTRLPRDHPLTARCLIDQAVLLGIQGHWNEATASADAARRAARSYASGALSMLSEQEQLRFLNADAEFALQFHQAVSMAYVRPKDPEVVERSAAWVLNGKAIAHEVLAERSLLLRKVSGSGDINLRPLLIPELQRVRQQLAAALFAAPSNEDEARHRAHIEDLRKQERTLTINLGLKGENAARENPWVELAAVRKAMGDAVLIEIVRLRPYSFQEKDLANNPWQPHRYVAWIIPPAGKGEVRFVDLGDAELIEAAVERARRGLETPRGANEAEGERSWREPLAALSRLLLDPLAAAAGPSRRWIISPDGDLWLVPWSALTFADGTFAIEKLQLRYLVSGRQLVEPRELAKSAGTVVMADPDYDLADGNVVATTDHPPAKTAIAPRVTARSGDIRGAHWRRLPGTAAEARAILPQLEALGASKPMVFLDKDALETEFKKLVRPKVLVVSTHGFFLERQEGQTMMPLPSPVPPGRPPTAAQPKRGLDLIEPDAPLPLVMRQSGKGVQGLENPLLRCGLVLAGANRRDEASPQRTDDGILTGLEIVATDLRGTELVVLSACETGLGQVHNGEGVAGLRQAFQLAGARAVAATLWQIPDKETARLMELFFTELKRSNGANKAEALRQAQLAVIRERREKNGGAHPFYWAAFTLTGS